MARFDARIPDPVLRTTVFERVRSWLLSAVLLTGAAVALLSFVYVGNLPPQVDAVAPIEFIELSGGSEDGNPDESLLVESPDPETPDAANDPLTEQEPQVEEMLESVSELADQVAAQVQQTMDVASSNSGRAGSAHGTGGRPLGSGAGDGGLSREQRWYVRFDQSGSLQRYAEQLDFFGIELGALLPDGRLVYLSKLSSPKSMQRESRSGKGEDRLYMVWRAGPLQKADRELFAKAGVQTSGATFFHFYSPQTEATLANLELAYANRNVKDIRRTYFLVTRAAGRYQFVVTRQTYF